MYGCAWRERERQLAVSSKKMGFFSSVASWGFLGIKGGGGRGGTRGARWLAVVGKFCANFYSGSKS